MQEQLIIQMCHRGQYVLEKCEIYFPWLWDNKSQEAHKSIVSKKNSESGVITQTLLISVFVKSARRLTFVRLIDYWVFVRNIFCTVPRKASYSDLQGYHG